jgi:hypothetical protein
VAALKVTKVKDAQIKNILDQAKLLATLGKVGIWWSQQGTDKRNTMAKAMARQASVPHPAPILWTPTLGWRTMLGKKYIARDKNPRYCSHQSLRGERANQFVHHQQMAEEVVTVRATHSEMVLPKGKWRRTEETAEAQPLPYK